MSLFSRKGNALGLDIGTTSVKIVQIKKTPHEAQIVNYGIAPLPPEAIVDGMIMDFEPILTAINQILKEKNIKEKNVSTSVSGRAVIVKKVQLPMMSDEELADSIAWEAEQHIPFAIDDVEVDYQLLRPALDSKQLDVLLVASKKEKINNLTNLIRNSGLNPVIIDVDAFAIENSYEFSYPDHREDTVALVDIGAELTNINIISEGIPFFTRDISFGGNTFTKIIQKELLLSFEQAEETKIGLADKERTPTRSSQFDLGESDLDTSALASLLDEEGEATSQVEEIVSKQLEELATEIMHSFDFYKTSGEEKDIERVVLSGGSSRLHMIREQLSEHLNLPVEVSNPLNNLTFDSKKIDYQQLENDAPYLNVAIGLALRETGAK